MTEELRALLKTPRSLLSRRNRSVKPVGVWRSVRILKAINAVGIGYAATDVKPVRARQAVGGLDAVALYSLLTAGGARRRLQDLIPLFCGDKSVRQKNTGRFVQG